MQHQAWLTLLDVDFIGTMLFGEAITYVTPSCAVPALDVQSILPLRALDLKSHVLALGIHGILLEGPFAVRLRANQHAGVAVLVQEFEGVRRVSEAVAFVEFGRWSGIAGILAAIDVAAVGKHDGSIVLADRPHVGSVQAVSFVATKGSASRSLTERHRKRPLELHRPQSASWCLSHVLSCPTISRRCNLSSLM